MGLVNISLLGIVVIVSTILISCVTINHVLENIEECGNIYNITNAGFKGIFILYPQLAIPMRNMALNMLAIDKLENKKVSGDYITGCFHEINNLIRSELSAEDEIFFQFANIVSEHVVINEDGTISDNVMRIFKSIANGILSAVKYIRKHEDYHGYILPGFKI